MQKVNNNQIKAYEGEIVSKAVTLYTFGDSITAGTGASDAAHRYVNLLAAAKGWSLTNVGNSGKRMNDAAMIDAMYAEVVGENKVYTLLSGVNDARTGGTDLTLLDSFRGCLQAGIAWLAIPDAYKIKAVDATRAGTWAQNTTVYGGMDYKSTTVNSTIQAVVRGTTAYLGYIRAAASGGTFSVSIDGVSYGTYSTGVTTPTRQDGDTGQYGAYLLRFPGLTYGDHTILVTVTSATNASNAVYIDWFGGNGVPEYTDSHPVYVGNCLRASDTYYSGHSPASDAAVTLYNNVINDAISSLTRDGLNVCLVDVVTSQDRAADLDADGLHPNNTGHQKLSDLFETAMSSVLKSRDRGMVNVRNTGWRAATLGTGWSNFDSGGSTAWGGPRFMKDANGFVNLRGLAKNTSGGANTSSTNPIILTLPQGFRPKERVRIGTVAQDVFSEFDIYPDGTIVLPTGVSIANNSWFSFSNCRFYADQ